MKKNVYLLVGLVVLTLLTACNQNDNVAGEARSVPSLTTGIGYVLGESNYVYAFDTATGRELWAYQTDDPLRGPIVIEGNTGYVLGEANYVYAFDVRTGTEKWAFQTDDGLIPPVVFN